MIGFLNRELIFEFRDEGQLEQAFSYYAERHGCDVLFICDRADNIKLILKNGSFTKSPNLNDETHYLIYGCPKYNETLPEVGDPLPSASTRGFRDWEILGVDFVYSAQFRVPKLIGDIV